MKKSVLISLLTVVALNPLAALAEGSGHEAGRNWAEEKGIDDPDDCGGNSDSFIEGCQEYAEEQQEEEEQQQEDEDEEDEEDDEDE